MRRSIRAISAVLAAQASMLAAAPPAGAYLRDLVVVEHGTPRASQARQLVERACPNGSWPIGGAAFVSPRLGNLALTSALPSRESSVEAGAVESDPVAASWSLSSRAFCAREVQHLYAGASATYIKDVSRHSSGSARSSQDKAVTVHCPGGKHAVSGGGDVGADDVALGETRRVSAGAGWRVSAHEVDPTPQAWALTAHVVCANLTTETPFNHYVGRLDPSSRGQTQRSTSPFLDQTAFCSPGTHAIGGGARVTGSDDVALTSSRPLGTGLGWAAVARETDPTDAEWRLDVRALCAPLDAGPPEVVS